VSDSALSPGGGCGLLDVPLAAVLCFVLGIDLSPTV
jgi:hypothetical protein